MKKPECPRCESWEDVEVIKEDGELWGRCTACDVDWEIEDDERDRLEEE